MTDLLGLTAAQQAGLIASGDVSSAEVFEFWRDRAAGDDLGSYLWVAEETPADPGALPPVAVKDLFCVEDVPSSAGSRILEGYRPVYTATSVRNGPELKRALNRSTVCGVREISGTRTMAPLPCSSVCAMAWR